MSLRIIISEGIPTIHGRAETRKHQTGNAGADHIETGPVHGKINRGHRQEHPDQFRYASIRDKGPPDQWGSWQGEGNRV